MRAVLRDGIAETEVDQTFSNPGSQPLEGWYWFTVPADAIVTSFALETERAARRGGGHREAARPRRSTRRPSRQAYDPALLEWVDGRSYRARIFPIPASGTRRVVLRYTQLLPHGRGQAPLRVPAAARHDPVRFDEFALSVDLGDAGAKWPASRRRSTPPSRRAASS